MVAFTRFSFLMRRVFFRLMHQDLNTILDGLRELEARGVDTLDCRSAQFSADEPVTRLRMICQSWKVMFHAEYSVRQPVAHAGGSAQRSGCGPVPHRQEGREGCSLQPPAGARQGSSRGRPVCSLATSEVRRVRSHRRSRLGPGFVCYSTRNRETTTKFRQEIVAGADHRHSARSTHRRIRERRAELGSGHGIDYFRRR